MKVLVTSATFGSPAYKQKWVEQKGDFQVDFKRYTDDNFPSRKNALHPRMKSKIPKMMSHILNPGYDYYVWLDSNFEITREDAIQWLIDQCKGAADIAVFKHPNRSSIEQELDFMSEEMHIGNKYLLDRYDGEDMEAQVETYLNDSEFVDIRLFACGAFIYKPTNKIKSMMSEWIAHNILYSVQDQLSFPYVLQKNNVLYRSIDMNIFGCPYLKYN